MRLLRVLSYQEYLLSEATSEHSLRQREATDLSLLINWGRHIIKSIGERTIAVILVIPLANWRKLGIFSTVHLQQWIGLKNHQQVEQRKYTDSNWPTITI